MEVANHRSGCHSCDSPNEPSCDQLNFFLDPLIDNIVESWTQGIQFLHTILYTEWVTRSAMACIICDLPAAQKTAQLAAATSYFYYSACHCFHLNTLGRTDVHHPDWAFRDKDTLHQHAELYIEACSSAEHHWLFIKYGVQWSSLWQLPYWDPPWQLVVDVMHCLLEGLAQAHFREYLGFTMVAASKAQVEAESQPMFA